MPACLEHVANDYAIFSERGGQIFCLYSFYISFNSIDIVINLLSKLVVQVMTKYLV